MSGHTIAFIMKTPKKDHWRLFSGKNRVQKAVMRFLDFFKKGFLLFVTFAIFIAILQVTQVVGDDIWAVWAGVIIAFFNFVVGVFLLSWGFEKEDKYFYGAYYGGMIGRLILIFISLFVLIHFFHFAKAAILVSLIFFYFAFLVLEVWMITKNTALKGGNK